MRTITEYAQQNWQATPQTVLTTAQVQDILNQVFLRRTERSPEALEIRNIQPIYSPFVAPIIETVKSISTRPGLFFIALLVVAFLFWLVIKRLRWRSRDRACRLIRLSLNILAVLFDHILIPPERFFPAARQRTVTVIVFIDIDHAVPLFSSHRYPPKPDRYSPTAYTPLNRRHPPPPLFSFH